ncbi:hypothetical protein PoB_007701500 [Plakobranchus ocellatus]|uniref:Uncharacterized protein n=1 Tax=Plakobranchus ocellatus TaxID=259542 RepID=A0AAV4E2P4_9GAST|nr:hypothetical protein PoB_007701500 [Plakobranchus ocellatus]
MLDYIQILDLDLDIDKNFQTYLKGDHGSDKDRDDDENNVPRSKSLAWNRWEHIQLTKQLTYKQELRSDLEDKQNRCEKTVQTKQQIGEKGPATFSSKLKIPPFSTVMS